MAKDIENEIQSWIAVRSFAVEDANPQAPIIDANELAEFVTAVFKKLEGFVLVPVEPTLLMQRAGSAEAIKPNLGIVSMRDIYKAMLEAARGGNE